MNRYKFMDGYKREPLTPTLNKAFDFLNSKKYYELQHGELGPQADIVDVSTRKIILRQREYKCLEELKEEFIIDFALSCPGDGFDYFLSRTNWQIIQGDGSEVVMWLSGYWITQSQFDDWRQDYAAPMLDFRQFMMAKK